jgi:hypothetical protein
MLQLMLGKHPNSRFHSLLFLPCPRRSHLQREPQT